MVQYYLDLKKQIQNIKEVSLSQGQIQKIYSTAFYISLAIRAPGKTWHLYFGRGGGYEGVWIHNQAPPSEIRRKDNFLEYFRKHLSSCSFLNLDIDPYDRIVKLDYQKYGNIQSFLWFWKGRKLYFAHSYQEGPGLPFKLFLSWRPKAFIPDLELNELYDYFNEVGRHKEMKHDFSSNQMTEMETLLAEEATLASIKVLSSSPNFLLRKKINIEDDLRKAKQWEKLQSLLDKNTSLENMYELKVDDQKIKFEGELNPFERRNLVYEKIKKLKRGESILKERLDQVQEQISGKEIKEKSQSKIPMIKPVWGEEKSLVVTSSKSSSDEYKVFKYDLMQIGVGLNAHGNDQLRNKWASKEDYWIHLDGMKSTHGVIKMSKGLHPTTEAFNLAASIVAHFSHFQSDWVPIIYTQVKNLKGVSGAPGMVIYKKEKHLRCPNISFVGEVKE